jgi:hypothetical protein
MQFRIAFALEFLVVAAALAQTSEDGLRSQIATVRYATLAEQARIQGDVHLKLNSGVVTVLSGHPLLARIAVESAKAFGPVQGRTDLDVTYHFVLVDTNVLASTIVKRGNALERAVLRMLGLKTEKVVHGCQEGIPPANDVKLAVPVIEVWIYGGTHCLQTQAATLVARR